MDFQVQKGVTISTTLYAAGDHSPVSPGFRDHQISRAE